MTEQIKRIEMIIQEQLPEMKTMTSSLKQELTEPPVKISDTFLVDFLKFMITIIPPNAVEEFKGLNVTFNNLVQTLSFYYNYYISQMSVMMQSNELRLLPITKEEMEIKIKPIQLVFRNIYSHLKFLLIVNMKALLTRHNVNYYMHSGYYAFLNDITITVSSKQSLVQINDNQQLQQDQGVQLSQIDQLQQQSQYIGNPDQFQMETSTLLSHLSQMNQQQQVTTMNTPNTSYNQMNQGQYGGQFQPFHHLQHHGLHQKKTQRIFLDKKTKTILKQWFTLHESYPYPTEIEKNQLSMQCNISMKQLNTWFANYRSRYKKKFV